MERPPLAMFADGCREGKLRYTVDAAGRPVFPPRAGLDWAESAGLGTVYATTSAHPRDGEPYDVSLIDLDEGFRMMSTVRGGGEIGMRVRVAFDDDARPVFEPA